MFLSFVSLYLWQTAIQLQILYFFVNLNLRPFCAKAASYHRIVLRLCQCSGAEPSKEYQVCSFYSCKYYCKGPNIMEIKIRQGSTNSQGKSAGTQHNRNILASYQSICFLCLGIILFRFLTFLSFILLNIVHRYLGFTIKKNIREEGQYICNY